MTGSPLVALKLAVAVAILHGAPAGLAALDGSPASRDLRVGIACSWVRAHLLRSAGDRVLGRAGRSRGADLAIDPAERNYLLQRSQQLGA